jgi:hypothetical protein
MPKVEPAAFNAPHLPGSSQRTLRDKSVPVNQVLSVDDMMVSECLATQAIACLGYCSLPSRIEVL